MFFHRDRNRQEEDQKVKHLFVYGTLSFPEIISAAIGRKLNRQDYTPATLHGFKRYAVKGARFPVIRRSEGGVVEGFFVFPVNTIELIRLDDWEGGLYERIEVTIGAKSGESLHAWTYADVHNKAPILEHDWNPNIFLKNVSSA